MKWFKHLYILFVLLCGYSHAQGINSIKQEIELIRNASYTDSAKLFSRGEQLIEYVKKNDNISVIAEVHLLYGNHFFYIRKFDKAKAYYNQSLNEAIKYKNPSMELLARIRLAFLSYETGYSFSAEDDLRDLLKEAKVKKDYENTAELLNLVGIICEDKSDAKGALKLYLEGLSLAELNNYNYYKAVFRNNLGLIKWSNGQNKEALIDFEEGLKIANQEKNKRLSSHIQMNICMIKVEENNPEQALKLFSKVITYSKENNLPQELASNYINLSTSFSNAKLIDVAVQYIDSAIEILKFHKFEGPLTKAFLSKATIFIDNGNFNEAQKSLNKAIEIANQASSRSDVAACHLLSYRIYDAQKKPDLALKEYLAYSKINDSLKNEVNSKVVTDFQNSFDLQRKEVELEREKSKSVILQKSNEQERLLKWVSIAAGILVIVFLVMILNNRYVRKLRERQQAFSMELLESIEEERKMIAIDLHDDIGQSLSIIKSKISKQQQSSSQLGDVELELSKVIEQTREISKRLFPSNIEKIGLIRSIALMMENVQKSSSLVCSFEITEKIETLTLEQKTHIFRIIQECTNNTIKHAEATGLKINVSENNNDYELLYQDNGKGIENNELSNGIGLRSLRERAKILNGTIEIQDEKNGKGFKLIIKFSPNK